MCNAYFYCNNGTQSAEEFCPEGLLFNGKTCDFSHRVQCQAECDYGESIQWQYFFRNGTLTVISDGDLQVWHGDEGTWETYGGFKPANETNLREDFNMFDDDFETYWHSLGVRNSLQISY